MFSGGTGVRLRGPRALFECNARYLVRQTADVRVLIKDVAAQKIVAGPLLFDCKNALRGSKSQKLTSTFFRAYTAHNMDILWTPWRYQYVTSTMPPGRKGVPEELAAWPGDLHCVFCNILGATRWAIEQGMPAEEAEKPAHVLLQAKHNYIVLNAYPYVSGHLMVVPYVHEQSLANLDQEAADEMMDLTRRAERAMRKVYGPDGVNLGMNLGKAAGAGVQEHIHMHMLPRWVGDNNFLSVIGETKILPEMLDESWKRLRKAFTEV